MNALAPLHVLAPIGLDELNAQAELQVRVDRKYILAVDRLPRVLAGLAGTRARVLEIDGERALRYASLYFDTPGLDSYLGAARGRRRRFKVRARTYLDSGGSFLEVKTRGGRSATVKDRVPVEGASLDEDGVLYATALLSDAGIPRAEILARDLDPILETGYRRITLMIPEADGSTSRATIDVDLSWNDLTRGGFTLPDTAIVETKTGQRPGTVDRLLWRAGHRPTTLSKYGTGLASIRPELPHNKWHRVLDRYFAAANATAAPLRSATS
ncbi:MAG: polyphosphate polymerase domain-containing protein [Microbacterium sp.]|uniref:polyphosphate polymerase domain-containing protein n=1 Tax=Microbacterium sp. TaxID=51671 RepID=UPI0039E5DBE7